MGYTNRGTPWMVVQQALSARTTEAADFLRSMEVARLNALQAAVWDQAEAGDPRAGMAAVKIIEARCRVLGLFNATMDAHTRPRTVVQSSQ